jgi:dimethylhistidine N-methyltransferase
VADALRGEGRWLDATTRTIDTAAQLEVLAGLRRHPKTVPPQYFYDARGSELFERICAQPEYYLPRAEMQAMALHLAEIAGCLGNGVTLIEPGSGASRKVRLLLERRGLVESYVPVEICRPVLERAAAELTTRFPDIAVHPVCADFLHDWPMPPVDPRSRRVVYFPGSTIGNCEPEVMTALFERFRRIVGPDGAILVGIDLWKPPAMLIRAYDDAAGVTARFNLNILQHLNRAVGTDFNPVWFTHWAECDERRHRIEMQLVSVRAQRVHVGLHAVDFEPGEALVTEHCYKPTRKEFATVTHAAGLEVIGDWTDPRGLFSVQYLVPVD